MRVSRHNGRAGKNGIYNPKHNDREFDYEKSEDINPEMTPYNVYWNCLDGTAVKHMDRDRNWHSFTEVEEKAYDLFYKDYLEGQNARHIESRHKERCRTMDDIRNSKLTCPEETVYQIGNIEGTVDYEVLLRITADFISKVQERYGEHVHILNWALHLDEGTPHIHERHVFDFINQYGERQPKQEQALKEMGFERPFPDKKAGKFNNRKMSYDAECRKLFLEICHNHGVEVEVEPIYGGKKYLEKQEYILQKLEMKIEDLEGLVKEVSDIAYEKACDVLVDEIVDKARVEDMKVVDNYKEWIKSDNCKAPQDEKNYMLKLFGSLNSTLVEIRDSVKARIRNAFRSKSMKAQFVEQIIEKARPSILERLEKNRAEIEAIKKSKKKQVKEKVRKEEVR